jgi:hypothetical protein
MGVDLHVLSRPGGKLKFEQREIRRLGAYSRDRKKKMCCIIPGPPISSDFFLSGSWNFLPKMSFIALKERYRIPSLVVVRQTTLDYKRSFGSNTLKWSWSTSSPMESEWQSISIFGTIKERDVRF